MMSRPPSVTEADLNAALPVAECPLSHRVARRFFSSVILTMLLLIAASLIYIFLIQGSP